MYNEQSENERAYIGSLMLLDPEAVVLDTVDGRLVILTPADLDRDFHARQLLPNGYFELHAERARRADQIEQSDQVDQLEQSNHIEPNESGETETAPGQAGPSQRRVIARAQARPSAAQSTAQPTLESLIVTERRQRTERPERSGRAQPSQQLAPESSGASPSNDEGRVIIDPRLTERPADVLRERHQRSRRRLGRALLATVLMTVAGAGVAQSSLLRVTDVHIQGNSDLSADAVIESLNVGHQPSMLTVKTSELRDRLVGLPLIADAHVSKSWPNTLNVNIIERFGVASIEVAGGWVIIDQTGVVIDRRTVRPTLPTVVVDGEPINPSIVDDPRAMNDAIRPALIALAGAPSTLMMLTEEARVTGEEVTLALRRTSSEPLLVSFGRATDIEAKWKAVDLLRSKVDLDRYASVDLSVAAQPALVRPTLPAAIPAIPVLPQNHPLHAQ